MLETILKEIEESNDLEKLEEVKKEYIGKKWKLSLEMRNLKNLEPEERKTKGQELGAMKKMVDAKITEKSDNLHILETNKLLEKEIVDITSIGKNKSKGRFSKIQIVRRELENILQGLSFDISYENNLSKFIKNNNIATKSAIITNTSNDTEASSQETITWKAEWLIIDQNVTLANILDLIKQISSELLGDNINLRFRPSNLPYTKSWIAWDIACHSCKQKGCELCSNTWWIELFGAWNVELEKKDPRTEQWTESRTEHWTESNNPLGDSSKAETTNNAFIFSINITKLTSIKYTIKDTKLFHSWDLRFVRS